MAEKFEIFKGELTEESKNQFMEKSVAFANEADSFVPVASYTLKAELDPVAGLIAKRSWSPSDALFKLVRSILSERKIYGKKIEAFKQYIYTDKTFRHGNLFWRNADRYKGKFHRSMKVEIEKIFDEWNKVLQQPEFEKIIRLFYRIITIKEYADIDEESLNITNGNPAHELYSQLSRIEIDASDRLMTELSIKAGDNARQVIKLSDEFESFDVNAYEKYTEEKKSALEIVMAQEIANTLEQWPKQSDINYAVSAAKVFVKLLVLIYTLHEYDHECDDED
jgi:hypothetical protein